MRFPLCTRDFLRVRAPTAGMSWNGGLKQGSGEPCQAQVPQPPEANTKASMTALPTAFLMPSLPPSPLPPSPPSCSPPQTPPPFLILDCQAWHFRSVAHWTIMWKNYLDVTGQFHSNQALFWVLAMTITCLHTKMGAGELTRVGRCHPRGWTHTVSFHPCDSSSCQGPWENQGSTLPVAKSRRAAD